jgi:hypothetical protein
MTNPDRNSAGKILSWIWYPVYVRLLIPNAGRELALGCNDEYIKA